MEDKIIKKIRAAIFEADEMYSRRLMNYLNSKYSDQIEAAAFTKQEALMEQLLMGNYDCVVSSETVGEGLVPVIHLREMDSSGNYYRYGSAKDVARKILQVFSTESEEERQTGELLAIYAPDGGGYRTEYALKLAQKRKGIYLGMEEYCSFHTEEYWMEQILFSIRQRDDDIEQQFMDKLEWRNGIRILPSARCYLDYRYLQYEDYQWFFENIRKRGQETIICDIGTGCLTDLSVLNLFDRIFILKEGRENSRRAQLFLQLITQEYSGIQNKLSMITYEDEVDV